MVTVKTDVARVRGTFEITNTAGTIKGRILETMINYHDTPNMKFEGIFIGRGYMNIKGTMSLGWLGEELVMTWEGSSW